MWKRIPAPTLQIRTSYMMFDHPPNKIIAGDVRQITVCIFYTFKNDGTY
jgi:hypothetical protein